MLQFIKKSLADIVENTVGRSERVYKYRGRNVQTDNLIHVWNPVDDRGKFQYCINRDLPITKLLEADISEHAVGLLDSFIKMLEDSFPYADVYYRMAKNESNVTEGALEASEAYMIAEQTVQQLISITGNATDFLNNMGKMDFFLKYPDVVSKILEVYGND